MTSFLISAFFLTTSSLALAHDHREHGAHVHGAAQMNIAFDGNKGRVELHGPGDSFIGFEHKAVSTTDQQTQSKALETLSQKISEMVVFETKLSCVWQKEKVEIDLEEAGHSDVDASWTVVCKSSPVGSKITFNVQKFFPRVNDLDLQILADAVQVSGESKLNGTEVLIK